jgi:hypothetical protein
MPRSRADDDVVDVEVHALGRAFDEQRELGEFATW